MIKRGMTLIELIVAITLFVTVITIVIGSFASVSRTKMLIASMKESQQKVRLVTEMLTRYGKEAFYVDVSSDGKEVNYWFKENNSSTGSVEVIAKRFRVSNSGVSGKANSSLKYYTCANSLTNPNVVDTTNFVVIDESKCLKEELMASAGGFDFRLEEVSPGTKFFDKGNSMPPTMNLNYKLVNETTNNRYFDDSMTVSTIIILENFK